MSHRNVAAHCRLILTRSFIHQCYTSPLDHCFERNTHETGKCIVWFVEDQRERVQATAAIDDRDRGRDRTREI